MPQLLWVAWWLAERHDTRDFDNAQTFLKVALPYGGRTN
jgi:hypothetical protein